MCSIDTPVVVIYGGMIFHFMETIKHPHWGNFHLTRRPDVSLNLFAYPGDGFIVRERRAGRSGRLGP